jgi:hypothetical protein
MWIMNDKENSFFKQLIFQIEIESSAEENKSKYRSSFEWLIICNCEIGFRIFEFFGN